MHKVRDLVISCIDWRFQDHVHDWVKHTLTQADRISMAGAAKAITKRDWQNEVTDQIGLAQRLHGIEQVHIVDHLDCGAFGGSQAFSDTAQEMAAHWDQLQAAKKIIQDKFPALQVAMYLMDMDGTVLTEKTMQSHLAA